MKEKQKKQRTNTIQYFLGICNRLTALKCEVSRQGRTAVLLRGLRETHNTNRVAYLAKGTFEISELMESLHSEEIPIQSGEESPHAIRLIKAGGGKQKENKFHPIEAVPPGSC